MLQIAENQHPILLQSALRKSGALGPSETIKWKSPLKSDNFCEYRGQEVLKKLEIDKRIKVKLRDFWPARGPVWDGLGITSASRPLLIEAKAHIPEFVTPGTRATEKSLKLINKSIIRTRDYLAPKSTASWTGRFYQYSNRLAFQYYLRKLNDIDSNLVFLNFTNAVYMDGPTTEHEWHRATQLVHTILGLPASLAHFYVFHVFIDARFLTEVNKKMD